MNQITINRLNMWRVLRPVSIGVLGLVGGCHTPMIWTEAGSYEHNDPYRPAHERSGVVKQVLLYLPNRIVDALEVVSFPIVWAQAPPPGLDVRITRWGQLALQAYAGAAVGWDDRSHSPLWASAGTTAAFGPWRTGTGAGWVPSIGDWEVGVSFGATKVAIDLAEIVDFAAGWFFFDILRDDYGWS